MIFNLIPVQPFGTCVALGIMASYIVLQRNPYLRHIGQHPHIQGLVKSCIWGGIVGARTLYCLVHGHSWSTFFLLYNGGMSSQGALIGTLLALSAYTKVHRINLISALDAMASCAPLTQAIARIGCFFAGCCYGSYCTYPWAITYVSSPVSAPLHTPLHPAQLYSCILLLTVFIVLQLLLPKTIQYGGVTSTLYLALMATERFMIEFVRGEKYFQGTWLTIHQRIALIIAISSLFTLGGLVLWYQIYDKKRFSDC